MLFRSVSQSRYGRGLYNYANNSMSKTSQAASINIGNLIGNIQATINNDMDINTLGKQIARITQSELRKLGVRIV